MFGFTFLAHADAGFDLDSVLDVSVDHAVRLDVRAFADGGCAPDHCSGFDRRSLGDVDAGFESDVLADVGAVVDLCCRSRENALFCTGIDQSH